MKSIRPYIKTPQTKSSSGLKAFVQNSISVLAAEDQSMYSFLTTSLFHGSVVIGIFQANIFEENMRLKALESDWNEFMNDDTVPQMCLS